MSFYDPIVTKIAAALTKLGGTATVVRTTTGGYDPRADRVTSSTTTITMKAIRDSETGRADDGVFVTQSVLYSQSELRQGDQVTMGATTNVVQSVEIISPGDTTLMFKAVLA